MIRNHFKIALRNLGAHKTYFLINLLGLALGIGVCLMLYMVISFQSSFDDFHPNKDRIYRVITEFHHADANVFYGQGVPFGFPAELKAGLPQIEKMAPIYSDQQEQILILDPDGSVARKFSEDQGVLLTVPAFFDIFHFPLLSGSYASLKDPGNVLLSQAIANQYFGNWKEAIGRTLRIHNTDNLKVTGVLADPPKNSDFQFRLVISWGTGASQQLAGSTDLEGVSGNFGCYILLPPHTSVSRLNARLRAFSKRIEPPGDKDSHIIQPLGAVHFDTHTGDFSGQSISHQFIDTLWLIGALILLIACFNFINLSTAQAFTRGKEISVRKVMGSSSWQIKSQFLAETFLTVLGSLFIGVAIAALFLPYLNPILDLPLRLNLLDPPVLIFLGSLLVVVTLMAGFYPSFVLSRFNPIHALKSNFKTGGKGILLRRGLVLAQFGIAQALIIGTIVIARQMNYFTHHPVGFDPDAVVNIPFPSDSASLASLDYLRQELKGVRGIRDFSFSSNTPIEDDNDNWTNFFFDHSAKLTTFYAILKWTDERFIPTYKLPLVAGRNLEPSDTPREFVVNEDLLRNLDIVHPGDALNKEISLPGSTIKGPIVGVVKDFNNRSFRRDLAPLVMSTGKAGYQEAGIRMTTSDILPAMKTVEAIWNRTFPDYVFSYQFLDQKIAGFYRQERQLSDLYRIFAIIAIFLSCLGLYGLATFMAFQRVREVAIRKVLGASARQIVYLFCREFALLITLAFAITAPLTWYFMHQWLENYPFRINLTLWLFLAGGAMTLAIALITVSIKSFRAAVANPVESIRSE